MASHIPLVEEDRVIGLDGRPLAALPVNAWGGLPFEMHPHMQKAEVAHRYNPHPLLLLRLRAHGRSRIQSGPTRFDLSIAPGQVDVFSSGFQMDHGWWDCTPGEVLAVELEPERVRGYLRDDAGDVEPRTQLAGRDPVLESLISCMRAEVESGCQSGRLLAEGLSLSLLSRLLARFAKDRAPTTKARKLSPRQLRETVDFIDHHLGCDLGVALLGERQGMSSYTFARLFKATLDETPHQYVLARRIARAEMLLRGELTLSEIALAAGFANQSHFTEAFRLRTGRTPLEARRRA